MKQKDSSTVRHSSPRAPLGVTSAELNTILKKLDALEILLKKKDDHALRQTSKPLTFKEACAYLGYAPSYLYKLTYRKVIPHYKPTGKVIFFSKEELNQWIYKSREQGAESKDEGNEKDPNQVDMFDTSASLSVNSKNKNEKEVIIEFPLKSRRKKNVLRD